MAKRLIPLADEPSKKVLEGLQGGAWAKVDDRAKAELARRKVPKGLSVRAVKIAEVLAREFPDAKCALTFETPLQLLVATILSAQCTDARVNLVTPELFREYPDARSFAEAPEGELEAAIRPTGFFNNKAKSIRGCCKAIVENHGGEVPQTMEELSALPGVGRKTASVVRANCFGVPSITVDTHVTRIANRLGLTDDDDAERIEFDLQSLLPAETWSLFSHGVILHGRKTCQARKPNCGGCALAAAGLCPSAGAW